MGARVMLAGNDNRAAARIHEGLNLILKFKIKDRGGIGKIVYRVNGAVLDARPVGIGLPGHAPIQVSFPLVPGQNSFSVTAFNGKN
jgi:hypothetical protein